jgi:hypothetical protein
MFWERNYWFIVIWIWGIIWSSRESICAIGAPRTISDLYIILFTFGDISGNSRTNFMWVAIILEICMISDYDNRVDHSLQKVVPMS